MPHSRTIKGGRTRRCRGGVLVEFAFVALGFAFLFSGTCELGRLLFAAQLLQDAARVAARELAVTPLPATATFDEALGSPAVQQAIYDPRCLALDVTGLEGEAYRDFLDTLPVVNRLLVPLMVREELAGAGGPGRTVLHYPGAFFPDPDPASAPERSTGWVVRIPRVVGRDGAGAETLAWVDVIEEVGSGSFSITAPNAHRGIVALRLHYPFQAATLAAADPAANGLAGAILADDGAVSSTDAPLDVGAAAGRYGLGGFGALGARRVRPFRRFVSAQAVFRREVFR